MPSTISNLMADFLRSNAPEIFCVRGPWGVGKTYAWNAALVEATGQGKLATNRYSYVSLFGLSSIDAVRTGILENLEFLTPDPKAQSFGRGAKNATKFVPAIATLLGQSDLANAAGSLAFSVVRNQTICIDDVERRNADLRLEDVFGLASYLKETRGCRIIILLNEDQLGISEAEYRRYFEKVVDRSISYRPHPSDIAPLGITGVLEIDKLMQKNCTSLGISNIRIMQRATKLAHEIEEKVSDLHPKLLEQIAQSSALLSWSYYLGEGAPSIQFLSRHNNPLDEYISGEKTEQEAAWEEKLSQYGWGMLDELDHAILDRLAFGFFDEARLTAALESKDLEFKSADRSQLVTQAWAQFHASFDDDGAEIVRLFEKAYEGNKSDITPSRLDEILSLLRTLGRNDLADRIACEYVSDRRGDHRSFRVSDFGGFQPISDPKLLELFALRYDELKPSHTIETDMAELTLKDGWNDALLQRLASYSTSEYERFFRSLRGDSLTDTVRACLSFRKISNSDDKMKTIVENSKVALRNIANDSPLNAYRMGKFGAI